MRMMNRKDYLAEYEVSPLFEFGCFACDTCKGSLGLTHENVERLIDCGPLKCIRCGASLTVEEQTRKDLEASFSRMVFRYLGMACVFCILIPLNIYMKLACGLTLLNVVVLFVSVFIFFMIKGLDKAEPEISVSLKKVKTPEVKRRYRRQWRLE